ncbi:MAG: ribonuclease III [Patescibacteria group bacterium UBA2103]
MSTIKDFEEVIGVSFSNASLIEQALTHRSFLNENKGDVLGHNERLEFLGDAVLELATTDRLYREYPNAPEGELTAYRAALVNTQSLADIAEKLGVNDFMRLSKGEAKDTGRARQFILANSVEAIIGAIYLDKGYEAAEKFIADNFYPKLDEIISKRLWQDSKSAFQEKAQEKVSITPEYKVVSEEGPDHDKTFTIAVFLGEEEVAKGSGSSKQEAEQEAARSGLVAKGW